MQRGSVIQHHGSWCLRYYDTVLRDGQPVRKKIFRRLAPVSKEYPTARSVMLLADRLLLPINAGQLPAESSMTVVEFIDNVFLPHVLQHLKPATYKNYRKDLYEKHLKQLLVNIKLRDFRTVTGQRILRLIPAPTARNGGSGRTTLLRAKAFLSSVFKHAKREGFLDGENPMRDVSVPGKPSRKKAPVYTMEEIEKIATCVDRVDPRAAVVISVAAFTGLRMSEIRGLKWGDFDGQSLRVTRSVWRTHIGTTKTDASEGIVPVLPLLRGLLEEYRAKVNGMPDDFMFAGDKRKAPLNLPNLVRRVILPALANNEDELLEWRGWHAFRRSLASNLYDIGVSPKVIQAIMRHSDIGTTLSFYVQTPPEESRKALQKIEEWMRAI